MDPLNVCNKYGKLSGVTMQNLRTPVRGHWIIFTIDKSNGKCSMSELPCCHASEALAIKEAERLAQSVPGKKFVVAKVSGICSANSVFWE